MAVDLTPRVADLRLAVPAAVAWVGVAVLVDAPRAAGPALVWSVVVGVASAVLLARPRPVVQPVGGGASGRGRGPRTARAGAATLVLTTAALCALFAVAVLVGDQRRSPEALAAVGDGTRSVGLVLTRDLPPGARSVLGALDRVDETRGLRVPVRVVPAHRDAVDPDGSDGVERLAAGTRLTASAALQPDEPGGSTSYVVFLHGAVALQPPTGLLAVTDRARGAFVDVTARLPEPGGSLLRGLAIGDRSGLDPATEAAMETSALTHLTAVSGDTVRKRGGLRARSKPSSADRTRAVCRTSTDGYVSISAGRSRTVLLPPRLTWATQRPASLGHTLATPVKPPSKGQHA